MRGSLVACSLLLAIVSPLAATAPARAAAEPPHVTRVADLRGDQQSAGRLSAAETRSVDIRRLVVRRDARQLHLTLRVADVRGFTGSRQTATMSLTGRGLARQTFTSAGSRVQKTAVGNVRYCGAATRAPGRDTVVLRLPFRCIRSVPGEDLALVARFEVGPAGTGSARGSAYDVTRPVPVDPR